MGEEPQPATSFCKVEHHCNLHSASEVGPPVHINYLHFFYHFKAHSCAQLYHCKVVLFVAPKCCYQLSKHLQPAVQGLVACSLFHCHTFLCISVIIACSTSVPKGMMLVDVPRQTKQFGLPTRSIISCHSLSSLHVALCCNTVLDKQCGPFACSSFLWSPPWPFQWIPRGKWHSFRHSPLSVSWQGAALWCQWVRKLSESNGGFSKNCAENLVRNVDNRFIVDCGCSVDGNIPCNRLCGKLAQWKVDCDHGDNNFLTIFGRRFVRLYADTSAFAVFF